MSQATTTDKLISTELAGMFLDHEIKVEKVYFGAGPNFYGSSPWQERRSEDGISRKGERIGTKLIATSWIVAINLFDGRVFLPNHPMGNQTCGRGEVLAILEERGYTLVQTGTSEEVGLGPHDYEFAWSTSPRTKWDVYQVAQAT